MSDSWRGWLRAVLCYGVPPLTAVLTFTLSLVGPGLEAAGVPVAAVLAAMLINLAASIAGPIYAGLSTDGSPAARLRRAGWYGLAGLLAHLAVLFALWQAQFMYRGV